MDKNGVVMRMKSVKISEVLNSGQYMGITLSVSDMAIFTQAVPLAGALRSSVDLGGLSAGWLGSSRGSPCGGRLPVLKSAGHALASRRFDSRPCCALVPGTRKAKSAPLPALSLALKWNKRSGTIAKFSIKGKINTCLFVQAHASRGQVKLG